MKFHNMLIAASAMAVLAATTTTPAGARSTARHPTAITFNVGVQMPGKLLPAGTYIFERANPESSLTAVLVRSQRGNVQWLGLTQLVERQKSGTTVLQLSEAPRGEAPRVLTWFPSDSTSGAAFIY